MRHRQMKANASLMGALFMAGSLVLPSVSMASDEYTLIPDAQFEQVLINHGIDSEGLLDGQVLTTDMAAASTITADAADILDLTGIEAARSLKTLLLFGNQVRSVNLANNAVLSTLDLSDNQLEGIMDLSNKPDLISVDLSSNPNLMCVQVDNTVDAQSGAGIYSGWTVDAWAQYSNNCAATVPGN